MMEASKTIQSPQPYALKSLNSCCSSSATCRGSQQRNLDAYILQAQPTVDAGTSDEPICTQNQCGCWLARIG